MFFASNNLKLIYILVRLRKGSNFVEPSLNCGGLFNILTKEKWQQYHQEKDTQQQF